VHVSLLDEKTRSHDAQKILKKYWGTHDILMALMRYSKSGAEGGGEGVRCFNGKDAFMRVRDGIT